MGFSNVTAPLEISGNVDIVGGTVTISAVTSTVTVLGSVTVSSGTVSISSGTVSVSSVSGTVNVSGAVTITSGTVNVQTPIGVTLNIGGTVTVSAISTTVTVSGSVTISSGSVSVSSVSGTVTVAGSVTISSGTVTVSSVSSTVTVAGSVSISSGTVNIGSVSGTVTVSVSGGVTVSSISSTVTVAGTVTVSSISTTVTVSGSVSITSGTVSISSVSGTVNVSAGNVTVENVSGTSLLNTPALTKQATVTKTVTNASPSPSFSVSLNTTDRVLLVLAVVGGGTASPGTVVQGTMTISSVVGGTTGILYTPLSAAYNPFTYVPVSSGIIPQASPLICPVIGQADSSVTITCFWQYPGATSFSIPVTFTIYTAPDPSVFGTAIAPYAVAPTPTAPINHTPVLGATKAALPPSGTTVTIPNGYSWVLHYIMGNFSSAGNGYITEGLTGYVIGQPSVALGRQEFSLGGRICTGSFTINYTFVGSSVNLIYDVVKTPAPA